MSKVSFRARALDAARPMPVFRADEIPDLPDFATINRSVPQMPTGMEKEEETEHHLQRALSAQQVYGTSEALVIPIPEIDHIERYGSLYRDDFKIPKQYVHMQAFNMDQEIPDYDMDSDDEVWLTDQSKKMELSSLKFEEMMDRLEKGSGQQVVTLQEAKALLKEDDDLIIAVYDYWLNKRLKMQHPLILSVKTEKRDGSTTNNPYVAFRRRTEKMQTRKNRKNDEVSYEKMLKLRRDISRALTLIEMIKRREKTKKEMLQLTIEVLETRYQMEDFSGTLLAEAEELRHSMKPTIIPTLPVGDWGRREVAPVKKKREYKKRKSKPNQQQQQHAPQVCPYGDIDILHPDVFSSDDEGLSPGMSTSDHEDENDPDGIFAFRRKKHCHYHAPLLSRPGNWPWYGSEDGGLGDTKYKYSIASVASSQRCAGFLRRRVGRGGRVMFDRASTDWDDGLRKIDFTENSSHKGVLGDYLVYIRERKIPHYRARSPPPEEFPSLRSTSPSSSAPITTEFNPESFHSHQEQLMQMQRDQHEQMLRQETSALDNSFNSLDHSFTSQPPSHFTLDSASARFAASAVIDSIAAQLKVPPPSSTAPTKPVAATPTPTTVTNGPLTNSVVLPEKPSGLSTRPAATVLRLNFPLSNVMSAITTTTTDSNPILKVSSATSSPIDPLPSENHEDSVPMKTVTADRVVAMDVT